MCLFRAKKEIREHFPHTNWPIVLSFQLLISMIFAVSGPSVYQYVTSPKDTSEEQNNDQGGSRLWEGLGGTDSDYAWVQAAQPMFETGAVLVTIPLAHHLPFSSLLFSFVALASIGGGVYALAQNVWVAFVGRGLMGAGVQFGASTIHTYLGELGTIMDEIKEKRGEKPRKFILYIAFSFVLNGGFAVPYALTAVMSSFEDINPYRWPGWAVTTLAGILGLLVLLFFRETRSFKQLKCTGGLCSGLVGLNLSAKLRSGSKIRILTQLFVIACGYLCGKVYAFLFSMVTPVLDNKFGFNVKYTSFYLLGVSIAYLSSSFIHLAAKVLKFDNRIMLGVCLSCSLVGGVLIGDWQSIVQEDSCSLSLNGSEECNDSALSMRNCSNISTSYYIDVCESQDKDCYWNEQSYVTGEFCNTCLPTCLSRIATMDFYQFSVGVMLLSVGAPLGFVFTSAVASEITAVESQGAVLSLLVGTGAFSRAVSPIWFVASYDTSGRHTYWIAAVMAFCAIFLLLCLIILYKKLAPISTITEEPVMATSKLPCESELWAGSNAVELLEIWTETPL